MILSPFLTALCVGGPHDSDSIPQGRYVEARTASVFAGACHFNGELASDGREALLAWSFEGGRLAGVELRGLCVAALVVDEQNLSLGEKERRSVVYVPSSSTEVERARLLEWLRAEHGDVLGAVRGVRALPISLTVEPERYTLSIGDSLALSGDALADRACCKMPLQVWYEPCESLRDRLVGRDDEFRVREPLLDRIWSRPGENAAFFGTFGR